MNKVMTFLGFKDQASVKRVVVFILVALVGIFRNKFPFLADITDAQLETVGGVAAAYLIGSNINSAAVAHAAGMNPVTAPDDASKVVANAAALGGAKTP